MTRIRTVSAERAYSVSSRNNIGTQKKFSLFRVLMAAGFIVYLACVLYLVLGERWLCGDISRFHKVTPDIPYWTQVKKHIQRVPFRTILHYIRRLRQGSPLRRLVFVNLAGNLALFFPMGIFLPYFRKKQRNFLIFSASVIMMVCCVEVTQVLTLLGACDVDDLILNYIGAAAGFFCFCIMDFTGRKIHAGRS